MKKTFLLLLLSFLFISCTSNGKLKEVLATERNDIQDSVLKILAEDNYDPNLYYQSEYRGKTSFLSWAIEHPKVFEELLKKGANPNLPVNDRGHSILNTVFLSKAQTLLMLDYGLMLPGKSPLSAATLLKEKWTLEELKLLIKNGLDLSSETPKGETILMRRWGFNTQKEITFIVKHIDINSVNNDGMTALILAAKSNNLEYVQLLLNSQANVNIKDKNGRSVFEHCQDGSIKELLKPYFSNSDTANK